MVGRLFYAFDSYFSNFCVPVSILSFKLMYWKMNSSRQLIATGWHHHRGQQVPIVVAGESLWPVIYLIVCFEPVALIVPH